MRYTCHNCKSEHGTDNMVAYCASCYADAKSTIAVFMDAAVKERDEFRGMISKLNERLRMWEKDGPELMDQVEKLEGIIDKMNARNLDLRKALNAADYYIRLAVQDESGKKEICLGVIKNALAPQSDGKANDDGKQEDNDE